MAAPGPSSKKGGRVVWDEANLQANEEIKKAYSNVRIAEPKTPYRPPLPADSQELEEDMKPLQLDEVASALQAGQQRGSMSAFDYVMSKGGAEFVEPPTQQAAQRAQQQAPPQQQQQQQQEQAPAAGQQQRPCSSAVSSEPDGGDQEMADAVGDKRHEPCASFNSSEGGSEGGVDKRRKFELMRRQHYNMRGALAKAKQLLASEDEDFEGQQADEDEEDDEGDEDDTAGQRHCNGAAASTRAHHQRQAAAEAPPAGAAAPVQQQHGSLAGGSGQQLDMQDQSAGS